MWYDDWKHPGSLTAKKFKTTLAAKKGHGNSLIKAFLHDFVGSGSAFSAEC
jgi:hypothetical protein